MKELTEFLQKQRILQIAPHAGDPWIANVYMGCESPEKIYFIGSKNTRYGKKLLEDHKLAFATAWCNEHDHKDRKGIQGVGEAVLTEDENDIKKGVELHTKNYPEFADRITVDWINTNTKGSGVWVIKLTYIKFWDDEVYGLDGFKEFKFE